jgi:hypothetical protein
MNTTKKPICFGQYPYDQTHIMAEYGCGGCSFRQNCQDSFLDETDGVKHDSDKPRIDLVDPDFITGVARVLTHAVGTKYKENNWRKVDRWRERYYSAAMRHLLAYKNGILIDPDDGLPTLDYAACNIMFLRYMENK